MPLAAPNSPILSPIATLRPVLFVIGLLLVAVGALMVVPVLVDLTVGDPTWWEFLVSALVTLGCGGAAALARPRVFALHPRQMFILTTASWVMVAAFAALPFMLIKDIDYTDSFFETMSGITTTGATVLVGLDAMSPGILIWRSILQWLGGIGFIAMAVAILPFLRVGGMRLFQTESSDWSEKALPKSRDVAKWILGVYLVLSLACTLAYWIAGMGLFDAVNHAMTTVSTGGYSTSDQSMGHFAQPAIQWLSVLFMVLGSLPFTLYVKAAQGRRRELWRDQQVRGFVAFLAITSLGLALWLLFAHGRSLEAALRLSAFHVVSVVTTTGYAAEDYTTWGSLAVVAFLFLTFVGGCSGSTAGGIKIFRFQVSYMLLRSQLMGLFHTRALFPRRYNGRIVSDDIVRSILSFSFFFVFTICLIALVLSLLGADPLTALSGAATAVGNVGPGVGPIIGPAGNFGSLGDAEKWVLSFGMLVGRLEVVTVYVLLMPDFWRG